MSLNPDDASRGFLDSIEHAILIRSRIDVLEARFKDAIAVATSLARSVDDASLERGWDRLGETGVTGRAHLRNERDRRRLLKATEPRPPGWTCRRRPGEMTWWPNAPSWVYLLFDNFGDVIYIGKSNHPRSRLPQHTRRGLPWAEAELIACADERDALRLEGDLIHQYAPPWNVQDVDRRRFIPQEAF